MCITGKQLESHCSAADPPNDPALGSGSDHVVHPHINKDMKAILSLIWLHLRQEKKQVKDGITTKLCELTWWDPKISGNSKSDSVSLHRSLT